MIVQQLSLFETETGEIIGKESDENYTDSKDLELIHQFYGYPDLDPFSCELANRTVKAKKYFTAKDDGFRQDWRQAKTLWLNPPYSVGFVEKVVDKLIQTLNKTEAEAFLLTNTDNSTDWYEKALGRCDRFILPHTRLTFTPQNGQRRGRGKIKTESLRPCFTSGYSPKRLKQFFGTGEPFVKLLNGKRLTSAKLALRRLKCLIVYNKVIVIPILIELPQPGLVSPLTA